LIGPEILDQVVSSLGGFIFSFISHIIGSVLVPENLETVLWIVQKGCIASSKSGDGVFRPTALLCVFQKFWKCDLVIFVTESEISRISGMHEKSLRAAKHRFQGDFSHVQKKKRKKKM
jgi:hypothetical protein